MSESVGKIVSKLISDAPPGELDAVVQDVKSIVDRPIADLSKSIEDYSVVTFATVSLPGHPNKTILTKYNRQGSKFIDYEAEKIFSVDFKTGKPTEIEEHFESTSSDVATLTQSISAYVLDHFPSDSAYGVFPQSDGSIAIVIIDERYNPANFWNGKWKSSYIYDPSSGSINGEAGLDIHYYEDGNVRLKTNKKYSGDVRGLDGVVKFIKTSENKLEETINKSFIVLNESAFKNLRRQLPITRSKINWGKAMGAYKLGQEAGGINGD